MIGLANVRLVWILPSLCVVLATGVSAASCGVTVQGTPQAIAKSKVPFGLMKEVAPTTSLISSSRESLQVYMVDSGHLMAISRSVSGRVTLVEEIEQLLAGPTDAESFVGITTDLPAETNIKVVRQDNSNLQVNLTGNFASINGQDQILAIGQIVYSLTQVPGISSVSFELNGQSTEVPTANGTLVTGPVTRLDYFQLAQTSPGLAPSGNQAAG